MISKKYAGPHPGQGLRVLTVTNMYPTPSRPSYGTFVATQVESLRTAGLVVDVHFIDGRSSRWAYAGAVRALRRRLRSADYSLVHAHYGYSALYPLLLGNIPVVVTFHGSDVLIGGRGLEERRQWLKAKLRNFVAARAGAIIVQTQQMKEVLGLDKARVIPMGIDLDQFRPLDRASCRRQLGYEQTERIALFPYHPERPEKGFLLADSAMDLVRRTIPDARLDVVSAAASSQMPLHYNAADCLLMTSAREGSPNAVKEALACNLPVVSTDCGDVAERLSGVRRCAVVDRSPEAVAAAILDVLSVPDPRSDGREHLAGLDLQTTARRIIGVYRDLLP